MNPTERARPSAGPARSGQAVSVEDLHRRLRDAIDALETGDQWQEWLDFAQRLHRYSFRNLILIWSQRPTATAVASFSTWQSLNRRIRRGEKAIRVMAPITKRVTVIDQNGRPAIGPDGKPEVRRQITGYRSAPVFDVGQTDGSALPEPPAAQRLVGTSPAGLWEDVVAEICERGYRLMRGPAHALNGANGVTKLTEREVWVRDDVDDAQAAKTLVHELAHVLLHADPQAPADIPCTGIREVEAESVAHIVLAAHGIDTGTYSFPYVASWAYPLAAVEHVPMADIVARTGDRVMSAAASIIEATVHDADQSTRALTARLAVAANSTSELRDQSTAAALPSVERAVLLGVIADSHEFYRRQAPYSWVPAYLAERRLADAVRTHELGYAPNGWTTLTDHLRTLSYTDDHIEAAGMATRARSGQLIDRFRDRLTIPLCDEHDDLVGFTARMSPRLADTDRGPKYLNSPTTAVFRKLDVLYGLSDHRSMISKGHLPVLCEGPLDAIAIDLLAAQTGTPMVGIATNGTAFTTRHADQLNNAVGAKPVCIALDGDSAGRTAAETVWRRLTDHEPRNVTIANLPNDADPASLFASDPHALLAHLDSARPAPSVVARWQIDAANLDGNILRELTAFRQLMPLASRIPAPQRTPYILGLAERLRIDPAEAAAQVAEQAPDLLLDQVMSRCVALNSIVRAESAADVPYPHRDDPPSMQISATAQAIK
jgi:DNA primase catalytic core